MMWVVIPKRLNEGGYDYEVVSTLTGESSGCFGCYKWAQTHADQLNEKEAKKNYGSV